MHIFVTERLICKIVCLFFSCLIRRVILLTQVVIIRTVIQQEKLGVLDAQNYSRISILFVLISIPVASQENTNVSFVTTSIMTNVA